jgi:hypothetical protein
MAQTFSGWLYPAQVALQRLTLGLIAALALAATLWTAAAAVGLAPWLGAPVTLGGAPVDAGPVLQAGLATLLVGLCFFLPTNARVLQLENSHRSFHATMWDVARAYQVAHAADRDGVFTLRSEFDSVRERLAHLRRHPDLRTLEPEVLELAAQMSHESRELAEVYSEERVERARAFLRQRQEEAETLQARIAAAHAACREIRHWLGRVDAEEDTVRARLEALRSDYADLLPELGRAEALARAEVVSLRSYAAE